MPSRGWCILENDCGFDNIVANNQGWLLRYVKKIVGNEAAAEDIVQETFIRAYKAYDGYQETGRLRQWLRTIARNVALRYLGSSAAIREVNLCTSDENSSTSWKRHLGVNAKSGLYLAIPAGAKNIRIRRGNGVIDAGAYRFAFSERYVAEDECLRLEFTYLNG